MKETEIVKKSMRLRNMGVVSPRFWRADTRSRKTNTVKVFFFLFIYLFIIISV